jgi:hypothetical protein
MRETLTSKAWKSETSPCKKGGETVQQEPPIGRTGILSEYVHSINVKIPQLIVAIALPKVCERH